MPREDIGEEPNLDSNENYFYRFLWPWEKIFDFLIFGIFLFFK
jgi:hypothetical protein